MTLQNVLWIGHWVKTDKDFLIYIKNILHCKTKLCMFVCLGVGVNMWICIIKGQIILCSLLFPRTIYKSHVYTSQGCLHPSLYKIRSIEFEAITLKNISFNFTCAWVAHVMSHPLISMIWSPGCNRPSPATRPSGKTSWTTTHRRGVSEPPTMVRPRLALVLGISTWETSPSRMGRRVIPVKCNYKTSLSVFNRLKEVIIEYKSLLHNFYF